MDMSKLPRPESSVRKQYDLTGKHIVITGGAGFLGMHFAEAVAEMGALPILLDIDGDALDRGMARLRHADLRSDGVTVDLTDDRQVAQAVSDIAARYGSLDVLINAAALSTATMRSAGGAFFAPFEEYEKSLWELALDANLTGAFVITQAVGRVMKRQRKGIVINVASDVAMISPDHRIYEADPRSGYGGVAFNTTLAYSTTKAGMLAFTRYLATYWAKDGIRVNALSPAGVYNNHDPKFVEQLAFRIPLGRMAFPEECKGPIVFLASEASSFMTGGNLVIDGGRTAW